MALQDIIFGESRNIEFKEALPEKSIKYMKSVVAFANSSGGKILFGVEDGTCRIVGINGEDLFKTMDAITNAIADSCEPAIYPDISLQTIKGKTIIVVDVPAGKQRPFWMCMNCRQIAFVSCSPMLLCIAVISSREIYR